MSNRVKELESKIQEVAEDIRILEHGHTSAVWEDLGEKRTHLIALTKELELVKNGKIGETCMGDPINDMLYRVKKTPEVGDNEKIDPDRIPPISNLEIKNNDYDFVTAQERRIQHAVSCAVEMVGPESWKRSETEYERIQFRDMIKEEAKQILTVCEELKDER